MWSRNIKDNSGASFGRRCGDPKNPNTKHQRKCQIENHIFSEMRRFAIYCCKTYWIHRYQNTGTTNCENGILAYYIWLPGSLASPHKFNNQQIQAFKDHIKKFDPEGNTNSEKFCNVIKDPTYPNDPTKNQEYRSYLNGNHPANTNGIQTVNDPYPYFAWPTTTGASIFVSKYSQACLEIENCDKIQGLPI